MAETENPFVPGARVVVSGRGAAGYREDFVLKVHKTGNFTLRSDPNQQYRPYGPGNFYSEWRGSPTGNGLWICRIWTDAIDVEIREAKAQAEHSKRWYGIRDRIIRLHPNSVSPTLARAIEDAFAVADSKARASSDPA